MPLVQEIYFYDFVIVLWDSHSIHINRITITIIDIILIPLWYVHATKVH